MTSHVRIRLRLTILTLKDGRVVRGLLLREEGEDGSPVHVDNADEPL